MCCHRCERPTPLVSLKLTLRHLHSTQAQIIMRGTRSLGYGFVTYSSEAEAHKAVELLNKKEIAGREINVEGAKPQAAAPAEKPATAAAGEAEASYRRRNPSAASSPIPPLPTPIHLR